MILSDTCLKRSAKPLFIGSIPIAAFNKSLPFNNLRVALRLPFTSCTDLCEKPFSYIFTSPRCFGKYLLALSVTALRKVSATNCNDDCGDFCGTLCATRQQLIGN